MSTLAEQIAERRIELTLQEEIEKARTILSRNFPGETFTCERTVEVLAEMFGPVEKTKRMSDEIDPGYVGFVTCARGGAIHSFGIRPGDSLEDVAAAMQVIGVDPSTIETLAGRSSGVAKARHDERDPVSQRFVPKGQRAKALAAIGGNDRKTMPLWRHSGAVHSALGGAETPGPWSSPSTGTPGLEVGN